MTREPATSRDGWGAGPAGDAGLDQERAAGGGGEIVDLIPWLDDPSVRRLLAMSLHEPTQADVDALCRFYAQADTPRVVFGVTVGGELVGAVGAVARQAVSCEVLTLTVDERARRRGFARQLVGVAAAALHAEHVVAETDSEAVDFYRACGFTLEAIGEAPSGAPLYRASARASDLAQAGDGVGAEWFSSPRVVFEGDREIRISLPPSGNTLPLVPDELAGQDVPAFVVEWILETDEIGLMLQELLPERFPPTTPPVRPADVRDFLGPSTRAVAQRDGGDGASDARSGPRPPWRLRSAEPDELIPGLPAGVELPMAVLDLVEMGERIGAWLDKGHRVRRWAEAHGHGDAPWILPDLG